MRSSAKLGALLSIALIAETGSTANEIDEILKMFARFCVNFARLSALDSAEHRHKSVSVAGGVSELLT